MAVNTSMFLHISKAETLKVKFVSKEQLLNNQNQTAIDSRVVIREPVSICQHPVYTSAPLFSILSVSSSRLGQRGALSVCVQ